MLITTARRGLAVIHKKTNEIIYDYTRIYRSATW